MNEQNETPEQKQLWEINEIMINDNYTLQNADDGSVYYILRTSRADLPTSFWLLEW